MMLSLWLFISGGFGIGTTAFYMVLKGKDKTGKLFSNKLKTAVLVVEVLACVALTGAIGGLLKPGLWSLWNGNIGKLAFLFFVACMGVSFIMCMAMNGVYDRHLKREFESYLKGE